MSNLPDDLWDADDEETAHRIEEVTARREVEPDWKPPPRIRDPKALKKLRRNRECYGGCGTTGSEQHHILFRSRGGDDLAENLVPVCHGDHMLLHQWTGEEAREIRRQIGKRLHPEHLKYILSKLDVIPGKDYLRREYLVRVDDERYRKVERALRDH